MARIRVLTKDEVAPHVRTLLEEAERAFGEPLVSTGIQAYCPLSSKPAARWVRLQHAAARCPR